MKYTLLELTQDILSSMDSDEVNSIWDTPESLQVVKVIKTVYDDIISRSDLASNKALFNLTASNDTDKPVVMYKPETIDRIDWIKYNGHTLTETSPNWREMYYIPVEDFIERGHSLNSAEPDVSSMELESNGFTLTFYYKNDSAPEYYTSYNDNMIIFNSYDASVDNTLMSSKTLCHGSLKTDFVEEDPYVPNLQPQQFALLLNEAKSLAWTELKQVTHAKAEQTAKRNWRHLQKTRRNIPTESFHNLTHPFNQLNNFGRK